MILHRSLLTTFLATASSVSCFGQAAVPPAVPITPTPSLNPIPAAVPITPAPLASIPFKNASFEEPKVDKRTPDTEGGNPATIDETDWGHFVRRKGEGEGALTVGTTNEIARTGKQSIYLDFATIKGKRFSASLMTQLVPVKAGSPYKVGMWGRMDKDRPVTLDQRRPYLRMEFEFYKKDEETQVGDTEYRVIKIPGSLKRLLIASSKWSQVYGVVRAPAGAELMKVSYVFNVPNSPGLTDGVLFFDDAYFDEMPSDFPIEAEREVVADSDEEKEVTDDPIKATPLSPDGQPQK